MILKKPSLIYIFICLLLYACNSNKKELTKTPNEVFVIFSNAITKKDFSTARKYSTKESHAIIGILESPIKKEKNIGVLQPFDSSSFDFGNAVIKNNEAKIPLTNKESKMTILFPLKMEDGIWKVSFEANSFIDMIMSATEEKSSNKIENLNIDSMEKVMQKFKKELENIPSE
jgi:hypothetical protein